MIYDDANALQRWLRRLPANPAVSRLFARVLPPLDRAVFRVTRGRRTASSVLAGIPMVVLETVGARTGLPRPMPVLAIPADGGDIAVIASNWGRPRHPAWYHNLRAHPRLSVTVEGRRHEVVAREVTGEERVRLWTRGLTFYPAWAEYERRAGDRVIPVLVLSPRDGD